MVFEYERSECPYPVDTTNTHPRIYSPVDSSPAWEDNGDRIAFIRRYRTGRIPGLYTINIETNELLYLRSDVLDVTWFPSGDSLLVTLNDLNLYVINTNGDILRQLTDDSIGNWLADVSSSARYMIWDKDYWDV
jgi:Tol biopolymer transport system component